MSEQLKTAIFEKLKNLQDPISKMSLDQRNPNLSIVIENEKAFITLNIDPNEKDKFENFSTDIKNSLKNISNLQSVNVVFTAEQKIKTSNISSKKFNINAKNIIAIASGKGGVGKSTFTVNLAAALKIAGNKIGILDADIYGPSVPRMMGVSDKPKANENNKLIPLISNDIKCMSIGFLVGVDTPTIWRGPMVMKALEQMYNGVEWGELDYLLIDLPPGTGDAQLTLAQNSKLTGSIIISTPQDVALIDARKGINMFNKVGVDILGIVENMSYFICSNCNEKHEIFSHGGVKEESKKLNVDFLGELPIDKDLRIGSDEGNPICISNPKSEIAKKYFEIANKINLRFK